MTSLHCMWNTQGRHVRTCLESTFHITFSDVINTNKVTQLFTPAIWASVSAHRLAPLDINTPRIVPSSFPPQSSPAVSFSLYSQPYRSPLPQRSNKGNNPRTPRIYPHYQIAPTSLPPPSHLPTWSPSYPFLKVSTLLHSPAHTWSITLPKSIILRVLHSSGYPKKPLCNPRVLIIPRGHVTTPACRPLFIFNN